MIYRFELLPKAVLVEISSWLSLQDWRKILRLSRKTSKELKLPAQLRLAAVKETVRRAKDFCEVFDEAEDIFHWYLHCMHDKVTLIDFTRPSHSSTDTPAKITEDVMMFLVEYDFVTAISDYFVAQQGAQSLSDTHLIPASTRKKLIDHFAYSCLGCWKNYQDSLIYITGEKRQPFHDAPELLSAMLLNSGAHGLNLVVKHLLNDPRVDPNSVTYQGKNALYIAAESKQLEIIDILLNDGRIDPNEIDKEKGIAPLHMCAKLDFPEGAARLLKDPRVNPNLPTSLNITAAFVAVAANSVQTFSEVLCKDPRIILNEPGLPFGEDKPIPLLNWAVMNDCAFALSYILQTHPYNQIKEKGIVSMAMTGLLHRAAEYGSDRVAKFLIETGDVDPNGLDLKGSSPLFKAVVKGHSDIVSILLENPAIDVNKPDALGLTALHYAASKGCAQIVAMLLCSLPNSICEKGINPNVANPGNGFTPLHFAAQKGHLDVVKLLLAHSKVLPFIRDAKGSLPIDLSIDRDYKEITSLILKRMEKLVDTENDSQNEVNFENLAKAAYDEIYGRLNSKGLLQAGKSKELRLLKSESSQKLPDSIKANGNLRKWTVLHFACFQGDVQKVANLLLQNSIDPLAKDANGKTPLRIAADREHVDVVCLLLNDLRVVTDSLVQRGFKKNESIPVKLKRFIPFRWLSNS